MSKSERIRTPWPHRWRRFRYSMLPVLSFLGCAVLAGWMWNQQGQLPNAVGAVELVSYTVTAGADGKLQAPSTMPSDEFWRPFDTVRKDEPVAQLDDRPILAMQNTLETELAQLEMELEAEKAKIDLDLRELEHDSQREARRLAWQVEEHALDVLDRRTQIEGDKILLARHDATVEFLQPLVGRRVVSDMELQESQFERDEIKKRIEENTKALEKAQQLRDLAQQRLDAYPGLAAVEAQQLTAPFRAALDTQKARLEEISLQLESLKMHSPMAGTVTEVHCLPGQHVRAGDPIVTISGVQTGHIITYVRQQQRFRPVREMEVAVRIRVPGSQPVTTRVDRVGQQYEPVPANQLRDPLTPEWGLPVRIVIPEGFSARPGELIDVTFMPSADENAG